MRYTGVGGVFCGRGEMFMPNGVGNLQKGERYVFVHLIFNSEHSPVPLQVCQHGLHHGLRH